MQCIMEFVFGKIFKKTRPFSVHYIRFHVLWHPTDPNPLFTTGWTFIYLIIARTPRDLNLLELRIESMSRFLEKEIGGNCLSLTLFVGIRKLCKNCCNNFCAETSPICNIIYLTYSHLVTFVKTSYITADFIDLKNYTSA